MFGVSWLEPCHKAPEFRFVEPFRHEPPKPPATFRRMKMARPMKGVARKGRVTLARNDQYVPCTCGLSLAQESYQTDARPLDAAPVQVDATVDLHLAPRQALGGPPIKSRDLRWRLVMGRGGQRMRCRRDG